MSRTMLTIGVAALGLAATMNAAQAEKKIDPTKMTCEEFVALGEEVQPRVVAWVEGYKQAGKPEEKAVPLIVKKEVEEVRTVCAETPKQSLWERMRAKLPGGKKPTPDPSKMTCQEFVELEKEIQPTVAYYMDGYDKGTDARKASTKGAKPGEGEADPAPALVAIDREIVKVVDECREAPKESLWQKIKNKF